MERKYGPDGTLEDEFFDGKKDTMLDWLAPGSINEPFEGKFGFCSVAYETRMA